jgi:hypothetical protein
VSATPTVNNDASWLAWLCFSRIGFALMFTAYAAAIPLLRPEWGMSAGQAGLIQSASQTFCWRSLPSVLSNC